MRTLDVIEKIKTNEYSSLQEFEDYFSLELVEKDINVDRGRWFETSTRVYKCDDGFVGVTGVSNLYSEMMTWSDCECPCWGEEYKPVQKVVYIPVNSGDSTTRK